MIPAPPSATGTMWLTGLNSVMPNPWTTGTDSRRDTAAPSSSSSGAAPLTIARSDVRS